MNLQEEITVLSVFFFIALKLQQFGVSSMAPLNQDYSDETWKLLLLHPGLAVIIKQVVRLYGATFIKVVRGHFATESR